jgi:hypothetical protein
VSIVAKLQKRQNPAADFSGGVSVGHTLGGAWRQVLQGNPFQTFNQSILPAWAVIMA